MQKKNKQIKDTEQLKFSSWIKFKETVTAVSLFSDKLGVGFSAMVNEACDSTVNSILTISSTKYIL